MVFSEKIQGDEQAREASYHVELAMREIDDAQDAENERQADGDEHVAHAVGQTVDDLLNEDDEFHVRLARPGVGGSRPYAAPALP